MIKINTKNLLLFVTIVFSIVSGLFLILAPKFLIFDQILQKNGVYLIPKKINERILKIELDDTIVYFKDSKIGKFKKINIIISPIHFILDMKDAKGYLLMKYNLFDRGYEIKSKELSIFEKFYLKQANIYLKKDIQGDLKLQDLKISGVSIDTIDIFFKGKIFDILIQGKNINSKGSGIIVIDNINILNSKLTGEVTDKDMRIILDGSIEKLNFQIKPVLSQ